MLVIFALEWLSRFNSGGSFSLVLDILAYAAESNFSTERMQVFVSRQGPSGPSDLANAAHLGFHGLLVVTDSNTS